MRFKLYFLNIGSIYVLLYFVTWDDIISMACRGKIFRVWKESQVRLMIPGLPDRDLARASWYAILWKFPLNALHALTVSASRLLRHTCISCG